MNFINDEDMLKALLDLKKRIIETKIKGYSNNEDRLTAKNYLCKCEKYVLEASEMVNIYNMYIKSLTVFEGIESKKIINGDKARLEGIMSDSLRKWKDEIINTESTNEHNLVEIRESLVEIFDAVCVFVKK